MVKRLSSLGIGRLSSGLFNRQVKVMAGGKQQILKGKQLKEYLKRELKGKTITGAREYLRRSGMDYRQRDRIIKAISLEQNEENKNELKLTSSISREELAERKKVKEFLGADGGAKGDPSSWGEKTWKELQKKYQARKKEKILAGERIFNMTADTNKDRKPYESYQDAYIREKGGTEKDKNAPTFAGIKAGQGERGKIGFINSDKPTDERQKGLSLGSKKQYKTIGSIGEEKNEEDGGKKNSGQKPIIEMPI